MTARTPARLLVVDDEQPIAAATAGYFSALGYLVDSAREREEAEALLATRNYDVMIVDMQLTGSHGREGLELISMARNSSSTTRTIVLTAWATQDLARVARSLGAALFLEKPTALADLAGAVSAVLLADEA